MTTADLLGLVRRWWLLALVGLVLTAVGVQHVRATEPVYWTRAEVQIVAPSNARTNILTNSSHSLASMAGLVTHRVQLTDPPAVSGRVNLPDLGVRDGWQVRTPNEGDQWVPLFNKPIIDVQVVAPTAAAAEQKEAELIAQIDQQLAMLQAADGVRPAGRMTATVLPGRDHAVMLVGGPTRAEIATVVIGLWLTMIALFAAGPLGRTVAGAWAARVSGRGRSPAWMLGES